MLHFCKKFDLPEGFPIEDVKVAKAFILFLGLEADFSIETLETAIIPQLRALSKKGSLLII